MAKVQHVKARVDDPRSCKACLHILFGSPEQQADGVEAMWDSDAWEGGNPITCPHHGGPGIKAGMLIRGTAVGDQRIATVAFAGTPAEMLAFAQNYVAAYNGSLGYKEEPIKPVSNKMLDAVKPRYRPLPQGRAYNPDID